MMTTAAANVQPVALPPKDKKLPPMSGVLEYGDKKRSSSSNQEFKEDLSPCPLPMGASHIIREIAAAQIFHEMVNVINVKGKNNGGSPSKSSSISYNSSSSSLSSTNSNANKTDTTTTTTSTTQLSYFCNLHDYPTGCHEPINFDAIHQLILEFPGLCQRRFEIDWDLGAQRVLYPLAILACLQPPVQVLRQVYQAFPEALRDRQGPNLATPLHYACTFDAGKPVLEFLIGLDPESIRFPRKDRMLPLHLAAYFKAELESVQYLAETWPKAIREGDMERWTPLHAGACGGTSLEVMQYLWQLEPASIAQVDSKGRTPLFLATCSRTSPERSVLEFLQRQQQEHAAAHQRNQREEQGEQA